MSDRKPQKSRKWQRHVGAAYRPKLRRMVKAMREHSRQARKGK